MRVKAFGLNRMDLLQREGKYPLPPNISLILGVEFSGVVEELGAEAQKGKFKIGDEVFGLAYGGLSPTAHSRFKHTLTLHQAPMPNTSPSPPPPSSTSPAP